MELYIIDSFATRASPFCELNSELKMSTAFPRS